MLVAMRAASVAAPEAVLAELITTATEAAIPKAGDAVSAAVGAGHGMEDWRGGSGDRSCQQLRNGTMEQERLIRPRWEGERVFLDKICILLAK